MDEICVDIVSADLSFFKNMLQIVDTCRCGESEHILSVHYEWKVGFAFLIVWAPLKIVHFIKTIPAF